jgi:branched-chain amino acid transport system substrate-binding protein
MSRKSIGPWSGEALAAGTLGRRGFLQLAGASVAALSLAACSKPASETTNTAATDKVDPDFIRSTFGGGGEAAGEGLTITLGATLLLSTFQAFYGQQSLKGMDLAAKQIKAAGGPDFKFEPRDIAASTTAGADAVREFASKGIGAVLAGNIFNVGSMVEPLAQAKMLGIDPGGGTATLFQSLPYVWGSRALAPNDTFPVALQYITKEIPNAKKIVLMNSNLGEFSQALEADFRNAVTEFGPAGAEVQVVQYAASQTGGGDFAPVMPELRNIDPDVIFTPFYGSDPATFMKRYATAGLKAKVFGADFSTSTVDVAGSAFNGYIFAGDYFDADPRNDWGRHFIASFNEEYKEVPDYFPANYYETTFLYWELVKRVIAKGGDPNNGEQLQAALLDKPEFLSVYGEGSPAGALIFDPQKHILTERPMGVFEIQDGAPKALAYGNIGGRDFKLA